MFRTKRETREKMEEVVAWIVAGLWGLGVGMSLTIILLEWGMVLILLAAAVAVIGFAIANVYPCMLRYRKYPCPYCDHVNHVKPGAKEFECGGCDRILHWVNLIYSGAA